MTGAVLCRASAPRTTLGLSRDDSVSVEASNFLDDCANEFD
jgi:hypothetical protein